MDESFLIYLLFVYGLTLFTMGLAITFEIREGSTLPLAKSLWWLAGFGLVHSVVEWLEMLQLVRDKGVYLLGSDVLSWLVLFFLVVSGVLLVQFGVSVVAITVPRLQWLRWLPLSLVPVWLLALWLANGTSWYGDNFLRHGVITARYVFYIPGPVLSALALLGKRGAFREMGLPGAARDCTFGAAIFGFKAIVGGLIVPSAGFFPASVLNYDSFLSIVGLPPEVFRAAAAGGITYFVVRMLRLFEARRREEIEHVSHQLKRLSVQVLDAQEEERKRIARELHDETAQLLSSLLLRLKMLDRAQTVDEVRDRSGHIIDLAAQAAEGVRRMAVELRPPALEDLGLAAAIHWYAEELAAVRGLAVKVNSTGLRDRLLPEVELGLYRVVQEALTNVAKHAGASRADVTLEQANGLVRVVVEDDGCGFDVRDVASSHERGLGLFGMQERVSLLGGRLNIDSRPKEGTRITMEVSIMDKVGQK